MKNINFTRGILLGVGLFSAMTLVGTTAAQAAPHNDHRNGPVVRRDVKVVRKTVIRRHQQGGPNIFVNETRTLEGRVSNDLKNNGVILRINNGRDVRVTFSQGEPKQLGTGDVIRVTGRYNGDGFVARTVTILRNR